MPDKLIQTPKPDAVNSQGTASGTEAKGTSYDETGGSVEESLQNGADFQSADERFTVKSITKREG